MVYISAQVAASEMPLIWKRCAAYPEEEGFPVKTHPFLCGKEGVELIKKDIAEMGINTLVIAACSRRVNYDVFNFDGCIVDRVNLREQVVWSHPRSEFPERSRKSKKTMKSILTAFRCWPKII